jgi:hypothetical protein
MANGFNDINLDMDLDFSIDFDLDLDFDFEASFDSRYMKPVKVPGIAEQNIRYEKAEKLAKLLKIAKNTRQFCVVSGAFIFGDFIEAFIVHNNFHIKRMIISTLSMSQENIDSLKNLFIGGYVDQLDLIVSTYFYSHERHALIPYMYKELDEKNKFQLAIADVHTKICIFETYGGGYVCIHGSANLRSSNCVEQFCVEENEDLFRFLDEFHIDVIEKFKTINKSVRNKSMINIINKK